MKRRRSSEADSLADDVLRISRALDHFRNLIGPIVKRERRGYITVDQAFAALSWLADASDPIQRLATYVATDGAEPQGRAN